jgi:hypothetical protein
VPSILSSIAVQAVAGLGVFYGVYQFFKTIDENLSVQAASNIANLILGAPGSSDKPWLDVFSDMFKKVFGEKQLSWKCLSRSALITGVSMIAIAPWVALSRGTPTDRNFLLFIIPIQIVVGLVPNFLCILITRTCIAAMRRYPWIPLAIVLLLVGTYVSYLVSVLATFGGEEVVDFLHARAYAGPEPFAGLTRNIDEAIGVMWAALFAAMASSIWLWLFVISGMLLRFARVTRLGFNWFSRVFDLRRKPLACLGLVAGLVSGLVWWAYLLILYFKNRGNISG